MFLEHTGNRSPRRGWIEVICGSMFSGKTEELIRRLRRAEFAKKGYPYPPSQTPWQEIQRGMVDELSNGMVLKPAVKYQKIHATFGVPRDNH